KRGVRCRSLCEQGRNPMLRNTPEDSNPNSDTMGKQRQPWDQREDEPDGAYIRFLIFRNLGPPRTLVAAYQAFLADREEASEGVEKRAPGQWHTDCRVFDWVNRCRAWDIAMLSEHGKESIVAFNDAIRRASVKVCAAITQMDGPENWEQVLESLNVLNTLIAPEASRALRNAGSDLPQGHATDPDPAGSAQLPERPPGVCEGHPAGNTDARPAGDPSPPADPSL